MTIKRLKRINREFLKPVAHTLPENLLPFQKIDKKTRLIFDINHKGLKKNKSTLEKTIKNAQNKIIKSSLIPLLYQKQINSFFPFLKNSFLSSVGGKDFNSVDYTKEWQNQKPVSILKKDGYSVSPFLQKGEGNRKELEKFHFLYSLHQLQHQLKPSLKYNSSREISPFLYKLRERKKVSILYGNLSVKQIKKSIHMGLASTGGAKKKEKGRVDEIFFLILESRLDVALCRICFFKTIKAARQWIYHGKIKVNRAIVTFPGYLLQPGDVISVKPDSIERLKTEIKKNCGLIQVEQTVKPYPTGESAPSNIQAASWVSQNSWFRLNINRALYQTKKEEWNNKESASSLSYGQVARYETRKSGDFYFWEPDKINLILNGIVNLLFDLKTETEYSSSSFSLGKKQNNEQPLYNQYTDNSFLSSVGEKKQPIEKQNNQFQKISCSMILKSKQFLVEQLRSCKPNNFFFQKSAHIVKGIQKLDYLHSLYDKNIGDHQRSFFGTTKKNSFQLVSSSGRGRIMEKKMHSNNNKYMEQEFQKKQSGATLNNLLLFLQLKKILVEALFPLHPIDYAKPLNVKGIRKKITPLGALKPINLEVSYKLLTAIYLYPPQKIALPALLDIESVKRSFM